MCSGRCLEAVESTHEEEETVVLEILTWLESAETRLVYEDPPSSSTAPGGFQGSKARGFEAPGIWVITTGRSSHVVTFP